MSDSLRRSTRRVKKRSPYAVGDIVEQYRSNTVAHGRLVIKLSEEPPRWLVTFDEGSFRDEELAEDSLGPVVGKGDETEVAPKPGDPSKPPAAGSTKKSKSSTRTTKNGVKSEKSSGATSATSTTTSSAEDTNSDTRRNKKKTVSFSHEQRLANDTDVVSSSKSSPNEPKSPPPKESSKSSPSKESSKPSAPKVSSSSSSKKRSLRSRVSDREQRSQRRQAIIEEEAQTMPTKHPRSNGLLPPSKKMKAGTDEEVIKVPMLTGTLYLYRGLRRRVEFIRKY